MERRKNGGLVRQHIRPHRLKRLVMRYQDSNVGTGIALYAHFC